MKADPPLANDSTPDVSPKGGTWVLLTLALGFIMAIIDVTAVNVALPDISFSLSVPLTGLVWVIDGYTLTFAALLLAGGALADRFGPKRIYLLGLVVFVMASVLCGLAPSGTSLVAARLLQGVGAAMFMPSSLSLISHVYRDDRQRAHMVGIWSAMVAAAGTIGPLVGGILVSQFGWRSVFWINAPLGLLGIGLASVLLKSTPGHPRALSLVSHGYGVLVLGGLSYLLIEGPVLGWDSSMVLTAAAVVVITVSLLIKRERSGAHPLLPTTLLNSSKFKAATCIGFLINFAVFGLLFLLSLYLQQSRGSDALTAGLQLVPPSAAVTLGNLLSGKIVARHGSRKPMLFGLVISFFTCVLLAVLIREHTAYIWLVLGVMTMYVPLGIAIPAMTTTVMQVAGRADSNSAAATLNANRQIGALIGVALMGSILHIVPTWDNRLPIAFCTFAVTYGIASWLVFRFIDRRQLDQSKAGILPRTSR